MKKLLLGLGSIAAVIAPVASVVACGSDAKPEAPKHVTVVKINGKTVDAGVHSLFRNDTADGWVAPAVDTKVTISIDGTEYTHTLVAADVTAFEAIGNPVGDASVTPKTAKAESVIELADLVFGTDAAKAAAKLAFLQGVYDRSMGIVNGVQGDDHHHGSLQALLKTKLDSIANKHALVTLSTILQQADKGFHKLFKEGGYKTVGTVLQTYIAEKPAKGLFTHAIDAADVTRIEAALKADPTHHQVVAFKESANMLFGTGTPTELKALSGKYNFLNNLKTMYETAVAPNHKITADITSIIGPEIVTLKAALDAALPKTYPVDLVNGKSYSGYGFHALLQGNLPKTTDIIAVTFADAPAFGGHLTLSAILTDADAKFFKDSSDQAAELTHIATMLYDAAHALDPIHTTEALKTAIMDQFRTALAQRSSHTQIPDAAVPCVETA